MKTLKQVKVGDTVTVVKLHGEGAVKRRIMDMGLTKGIPVHVRKVAPLGDPIEVTVIRAVHPQGGCGNDRSELSRLRPVG